jgi:two-component system cell cycle sensor histidine kinase/response regulator CckA
MSDEAMEFSDLNFGGMLFDQMALPCAFFRVEYDMSGKPIKGIHLAVNQAYLAMMDRPREELLGHAVEDIIPDIEPIWLSTFAQVAATGQSAQLTQYTATIRQHTEASAFSSVKGTFGVVFRDVSELVESAQQREAFEQQMQQMQKLESLGVLAGGVAHDFNNILMSILGNADLALECLSPVSPVRSHLEDIESSSRRAAELCRQMLAYSGRGRFVVEPVALSEIVQEMQHMLDISISKKAVLKYNFGDELPAVEADVSQLRQIIMNMVLNASEAIGDRSGVICLTTGAMECDKAYLSESYLDESLPEGLYIYIEVADTGCGMDLDTKARVFDPFFTTKFTGRGLGLAAVLGIVRGHHGAIKIYSEPNCGSTFKILLPASEKTSEPHVEPDEAAKEWRGAGTILLADDEETVRAIGGRMIRRLGFEVVVAEDGQEALELFKERPDEFDCVVLDLTMPHMDGEEAFREIRRVRKDARVILSSGYNEQDVVNRFAGKGLAGFIQKPYNIKRLATVMREIMEATA